MVCCGHTHSKSALLTDQEIQLSLLLENTILQAGLQQPSSSSLCQGSKNSLGRALWFSLSPVKADFYEAICQPDGDLDNLLSTNTTALLVEMPTQTQ